MARGTPGQDIVNWVYVETDVTEALQALGAELFGVEGVREQTTFERTTYYLAADSEPASPSATGYNASPGAGWSTSEPTPAGNQDVYSVTRIQSFDGESQTAATHRATVWSPVAAQGSSTRQRTYYRTATATPAQPNAAGFDAFASPPSPWGDVKPGTTGTANVYQVTLTQYFDDDAVQNADTFERNVWGSVTLAEGRPRTAPSAPTIGGASSVEVGSEIELTASASGLEYEWSVSERLTIIGAAAARTVRVAGVSAGSATVSLRVRNPAIATRSASAWVSVTDKTVTVTAIEAPEFDDSTRVVNLRAGSELTSVTLNWDPPVVATGAVTYDVERSADGGSSWTRLASGISAQTYTDSGRTRNTGYAYRVRANSGAGTGEWTVLSASTQSGAPLLVPTSDFTFQSVPGGTSIDVIWEPFSFADTDETVTYRLQRDTNFATVNQGQNWVEVAHGIAGTKHRVTGLAAFTQYMFRVRAENALGNSGWVEIYGITSGPTPDIHLEGGTFQRSATNPFFSLQFVRNGTSRGRLQVALWPAGPNQLAPPVYEQTDWLAASQRDYLGSWLPERGMAYAASAVWTPDAATPNATLKGSWQAGGSGNLNSWTLDHNAILISIGNDGTVSRPNGAAAAVSFWVDATSGPTRAKGTLNAGIRLWTIPNDIIDSASELVAESRADYFVDLERTS